MTIYIWISKDVRYWPEADMRCCQQSTKTELVINLKTAKVFNISVPNTLIGRADELIDRCGCPLLAQSGHCPALSNQC
jgi:hypothetical protein